MYSVFEWVPQIGVEERLPLWRGWRGVLVNGEKRECFRESAGEDFIPYMTIFCYWGGDRGAAEVALKSPLCQLAASLHLDT
jgi:hypothetical protein